MAVVSTGLTEMGLRSEFFNSLSQVRTVYQDLTTLVRSTKGSESYRWLGSGPAMREWVDGRRYKGLRTESYDLENQRYEASIEVDRVEIDDDQTGQIRQRCHGMALAAATHRDELLEALFNAGATAGSLAYDGQIFFSAAHVSGESGTQDNTVSTTAATGTDPTVEEFRTSLKQAIARMISFKDDQGKPWRLPMNPESLVCVVPPAYYITALEAVGLAFAPSAENPVARNVMQAAGRVVCLPGLTATDKWYLCNTGGWVRPFIFQLRDELEFRAIAEGSEEEFKRDKYYFGVRGRYSLGFGLWSACVQATFT